MALVRLTADAVVRMTGFVPQRSEALFQSLVLRRGESSAIRLATALEVVRRVAPSIHTQHAKAILDMTLITIGVQRDPYADPLLLQGSLFAAAALLDANPEFFPAVLAHVDEFEFKSLAAAFVRTRPQEKFAHVLMEMVAAGAWTDAELVGMAEECDARRSSSDRTSFAARPRGSWPGRRLFRFVAYGFGVLAFYLASFMSAVRNLPPVSVGALVGGMALLAAIAVVAAELAASRLPGPIARFSSIPSATTFGVILAIAGIAGTVVKPESLPTQAASHGVRFPASPAAFGPLALLGVVLAAVATLMQLVRRSDAVDSARTFERMFLRRLFAAGITTGRVQARAVDETRRLIDFVFVQQIVAPSRSASREAIVAPRRGIARANSRGLERLMKDQRWARRELRLEVSCGLGTIVRPGVEIGAIVPSRNSVATRRDIRRVKRILRPGRIRKGIEDSAGALTAVFALVQQVAKTGDELAASRVSDSLIRLTAAHAAGLRRRSVEPPMNSSLPISVPIRALGLALSEALGRESHGLEYNVLSALAEGLIEVGGSREQLVQLLSGRLGFILSETGDENAGLALDLGIRALQTEDTDALAMVRIALGDNVKVGNDFRRGLSSISSQVTANAMWLDYFKAKSMWDWYWRTTDGLAYRSWFALRIGGAALLAGVASVATDIAFALRDSKADFDAMTHWAQDPTYSSSEKMQSDLSGRYLGRDPEAAMAQFLDFAKAAVAAQTGQ